ncbi:MAG: GNAT family N-acetyltransferase [Stellaceae bacterium]
MIHRIETPSSDEIPRLAALHRACFPDDPWDAAAIEQVLRIPGFFGRMSWAGGLYIGFAMALHLGEESEIVALGVRRGHRRRGLGSVLLDSICLEAWLRGAESIVLEVALNNDAARLFYAAHGFTIVGRRPNYYRQRGEVADALILRVPLMAGVVAS